MTTSPTTSPETSATLVDHLIIGAGFAGLAAAIKLDEAGERDFVVIEKDSDVGGTWHVNTYPGAECDVPSQLYCYSFALNPDWSKVYSPQREIREYMQAGRRGRRRPRPVRLRHRRRRRDVGRRLRSGGG